MPNSSFSNLYVVPHFSSICFTYLLTTSLLVTLCFPYLYSMVRHILLIVSVLRLERSGHPNNSHHRLYLKVTRGLGVNDWNFWSNMGATQPMGIYLPPPSCMSTQLCGFNIFNSFIIVHAMHLLPCPLVHPHHSQHCSDQWTAGTGCAKSNHMEKDCIWLSSEGLLF